MAYPVQYQKPQQANPTTRKMYGRKGITVGITERADKRKAPTKQTQHSHKKLHNRSSAILKKY